MSTETMRMTVAVLSVGWILWSSVTDFKGNPKIESWMPIKGFEAFRSCKLLEAEASAVSNENFLKTKGQLKVWNCFPSDFDPRPRK